MLTQVFWSVARLRRIDEAQVLLGERRSAAKIRCVMIAHVLALHLVRFLVVSSLGSTVSFCAHPGLDRGPEW